MMTAFEPISDIASTVDDAAVQVVVQTLAKLKAQVQKLKKKKDELNSLPEVVAFPSGPGPSQPKSADAALTMSSVSKPASEEKDVEDFALEEDDGDAGDDHYMLDAIEHPIVDLSPDDDSNQPGVLDAFTNNASDKQSTPTGIDTVITKKRTGCPPKAVVVRILNGSVANPVSNQSGVEDPNQLLGSEEATAVKSLAKQNLTPVHDPVKPQKRRGRPRKALVGDYATTVHHSTPDISANISPSQPYQSCSVRKAISTKNPPTILDPIKPKKRRGRPKGSRNKTLAEKGYKDRPKERRNNPATQFIMDTFYPASFNGSSMSKRRCLRSNHVNKNDPFHLELQQWELNFQPGDLSKSVEF